MATLVTTLPADNVPVSKAAERAFKISVHGRINSMPESWTGFQNQPIAVLSNGSGPGVLDGPLYGAGRQIWGFVPRPIDVSGSLAVNQNTHTGCVLNCRFASAVTVTVAIGASPSTSLQAPVAFAIARAAAAGSVTISADASVAVQNTTNRAVAAGGWVTVVLLPPNLCWLSGDIVA